jgi:hypothetical protein
MLGLRGALEVDPGRVAVGIALDPGRRRGDGSRIATALHHDIIGDGNASDDVRRLDSFIGKRARMSPVAGVISIQRSAITPVGD